MKKRTISRRKFIGQSCAAIGYTTLFSSLINLKAFGAAAMDNSNRPPEDYKALVCLFKMGGNDSFNMFIPRGTSEYNQYAVTRSNLAIPQNDILPVNPLTNDGQQYGFHPSMPEVQNLFETGKLALVSNVGTLIQPTTKEEFYNGSVPLPLGLFSHADQIQQWQTGRPHERTATGWGGRMADLMQTMNPNQNISMNISLSGTNVFQQGQEVTQFVVSNQGSTGITGFGEDGLNQVGTEAITNMLDQSYADLYKKTYVNTLKKANQGSIEFQAALGQVEELQTEFSNTNLSQDFKMVARSIAAGQNLDFERQIFFVGYGGWDHHDELLVNQAGKLAQVSAALSEFQAAMEELGLSDKVTTFSVSDFGRTLTSNGNGTDHAWGGNVMVMGGAVNGQDVYGSFPSLELDNPLEVGGGVFIPTTSADTYMAELAKWFGVSGSDLDMIFPNLNNFYDSNSNEMPIGFLNL